jgi:hypothetical protein
VAKAITTSNHVAPGYRSLAFDAQGNAWAVYTLVNPIPALSAIHFDTVAGTWSAPQPLSSNNGNATFAPDLALSPAGDALAVWSQGVGADTNAWASRLAADAGAWTTAQVIDAPGAGFSTDPHLAMDGAGNAWVVWARQGTLNYTIRANRYVAGAGWTGATAIDGVDLLGGRYPQVASSATGTTAVVWIEPTQLGVNGPVYTQVYSTAWTPDAGWIAPELLEAGAGNSGDPQVKVDATGRAVSVWDKEVNPAGTRIWGNHTN